MTFKEKLIQSGITPAQLAEEVGCKEKTVEAYMKTNKPSKSILLALEDMLSLDNSPTEPTPVNGDPHVVSSPGTEDGPSSVPLVGMMKPMPNDRRARIVKLDNGWEVVAYLTPSSVSRRGAKVRLADEDGRLVIKDLA
jgi:hypothetical protein